MRVIFFCLSILLVLIQYPLWLGKGGWLHVADMGRQVELTHKKRDELKARNANLQTEVEDLQRGKDAVEERARYELGMIKQDEIFVQVLEMTAGNASATPPIAPTPVLSPTSTPAASKLAATRPKQ
ncbi:cell division protein FtsB [Herbaspirillum sp. RTI4]|uniref:cell division protein FtsB n=1 Tax=Herbaspirillum sp. RTI4 TaxID=3048640 RepID=UPI002AB4DA78|nr:cell division protein FtsB [Herbaspirillum sp. RTI4]MDY7579180.1 cell division protein FtsB [Herbaspirillum sp. RTI4]MEA9983228.1 cell division protein FtsB [Herbaspirillum sp. RTI4]